MTTYRITYYRPYLPHPERDEPQRTTIIALNEQTVRDIYADCDVTHIEAVEELPADPEWEQKADDLLTIVEALDNGDWLQTATAEHADLTPKIVDGVSSPEWWDAVEERSL